MSVQDWVATLTFENFDTPDKADGAAPRANVIIRLSVAILGIEWIVENSNSLKSQDFASHFPASSNMDGTTCPKAALQLKFL